MRVKAHSFCQSNHLELIAEHGRMGWQKVRLAETGKIPR